MSFPEKQLYNEHELVSSKQHTDSVREQLENIVEQPRLVTDGRVVKTHRRQFITHWGSPVASVLDGYGSYMIFTRKD